MPLEDSQSWLFNLMRPKNAMLSHFSTLGYTDGPWCELFKIICNVDLLDYPSLPPV